MNKSIFLKIINKYKLPVKDIVTEYFKTKSISKGKVVIETDDYSTNIVFKQRNIEIVLRYSEHIYGVIIVNKKNAHISSFAVFKQGKYLSYGTFFNNANIEHEKGKFSGRIYCMNKHYYSWQGNNLI